MCMWVWLGAVIQSPTLMFHVSGWHGDASTHQCLRDGSGFLDSLCISLWLQEVFWGKNKVSPQNFFWSHKLKLNEMLLYLQSVLGSAYAVSLALGREGTGPASEAVVSRAGGLRSEHGKARQWSRLSCTRTLMPTCSPLQAEVGVAGEAQRPLWARQ